MPYSAEARPTTSSVIDHHRGPSGSSRQPTRSTPYTPVLTMAALITAETWLGASGWARGSQTWTGTAPALVRNPATRSSQATVAGPPVGGSRGDGGEVDRARLRGQHAEAGDEQQEADGGSSTAYQSPAPRTSGRSRWSASTSAVDAERHHLPGHQEGHDVAGLGDQLEPEHEES